MTDVSPFAARELEPSVSSRVTFLGLPPVWPGALCAQTDPEAFYPEKGGSTRPAKRICRRCSHTEECLEWALQTGERFGIWGATSPQERRRLRDAGRGSGLDSDDLRKKGAA